MQLQFSNMLPAEDCKLPKVLIVGRYIIYFWSDEKEPVHIHIAVKNPTQDATKIWLTKSGGTIIANNKSKIPEHDLNKLLEIISDNFFLICNKWISKFGEETLHFYC